MKELLSQIIPYLPAIITTAGTVAAAICAMVVAYAKAKTAKAECETEKAVLEKEKVQLEQAIINGSYIVCPNCGTKIYLKDVSVQIDR